MQKARRHPLLSRRKTQAPTACMHTVSGSLSLAVRRSFHRSLTVLSTIGHKLVFSLGGWSPQIRPGFLVPRPTRVPDQTRVLEFRVQDSHPLRSAIPGAFRYSLLSPPPGPSTPARLTSHRFGLLPVRSPLLGESHLMSSPAGT